MADSSLPLPKYSLWQALSAALSLSMRAIEEVRALAARPPVRGPAGRDGLGVEDFDMQYDGQRTFTFKLERGDLKKQWDFVVPFLLDAGVYREGQVYQKGDTVTFGGSMFVAQEDTSDKPETSKAWRLGTKKGRDGKDGVVRGPQGPVKL